jgi:hypothetical protein
MFWEMRGSELEADHSLNLKGGKVQNAWYVYFHPQHQIALDDAKGQFRV